MKGAAFPWFFAGGWAIDLFLGRVTRKHEDIDICVFRKDQVALRQYLKDWSFTKINKSSSDEPGNKETWREEYLHEPTHEIHAFNRTFKPTELEILLNERDDTHWIYRRNPAIRRPLSLAGIRSQSGLPLLAPEIVLLYKSKAPKTVDEEDFNNARVHLRRRSRVWLRRSIDLCYPDHHWLSAL